MIGMTQGVVLCIPVLQFDYVHKCTPSSYLECRVNDLKACHLCSLFLCALPVCRVFICGNLLW